MSLTRKKIADLDTSGAAKAANKAAKQARAASSAATANATSAAQNAAVAAQNATAAATSAAQNASGAAQVAAANVTKGVKERVYVARAWAAPRLESAADYTAKTVAPKVSSALRTTARQVSPPEAKSSKRTVLTWSVLGAAIAAALGAAAALARSRYRAAIAADTEAADEEVLGDSTGSEPAPVTPESAATPSGEGTDASVNGRVTTPGW
jgi:hypothetical protein